MNDDLGTPEKPNNVVERRFWLFHQQNPKVYELFDRFALEAAKSNRSRFGVAAIFERMRWYTSVETKGEAYKLNDNYTAYYGRLWMRNNPEHEGLFSTRTLKARKMGVTDV
jgi:hypothetical protein